jgi:type VI protein secretion system component VasK
MGVIRSFSLANAGHLPVTGDLHPLRKEFTRWLTWSNVFCIVLGSALFASWYVYSHRSQEEEVPRNVQIVKSPSSACHPRSRRSQRPP